MLMVCSNSMDICIFKYLYPVNKISYPVIRKISNFDSYDVHKKYLSYVYLNLRTTDNINNNFIRSCFLNL